MKLVMKLSRRINAGGNTMLWTAVLGLLVGSPAHAGSADDPRWFVSAYAGEVTYTRFNRIIRFETDFRDSYVAAVTGGRVFAYPMRHVQFEVEGQAAWHWGRQHHQELNAAAMARWTQFPWNARVRTTIALGIGPSFALATPAIERERHDRTSRRLLFMPFEITAGAPGASWEAKIRVHHRSGAFDVASRASGSNFVALGARWRF
jgi:hypothetical protein